MSICAGIVDKYDYGGVAHSAHLHQFACLLLDTLCHIDHYDYAVDGSECTVGVLGKILVTWSVEDVYFIITVVESHH